MHHFLIYVYIPIPPQKLRCRPWKVVVGSDEFSFNEWPPFLGERHSPQAELYGLDAIWGDRKGEGGFGADVRVGKNTFIVDVTCCDW